MTQRSIVRALPYFLTIASVELAAAGVNAGGVLVVHSVPTISSTNACTQLSVPSACSGLVPTATLSSEPVVWFVIVAFAAVLPDRLAGVSFGLGPFDTQKATIVDWGPCSTLSQVVEVSQDGWPSPNTGTAVRFACAGGKLVPLYYFVSYAYSATHISLTSHPQLHIGGRMADCSYPPIVDSFAGFGTMGFGVAGSNPCPTGGF